MSKKKRFGVSQSLGRGLTDTVNLVERNPGTFRSALIPVSRIEPDPNNPRQLAIDVKDVKEGLSSEDPKFALKQSELSDLRELSETIRISGVINPIVVYKADQNYQIVAGERRFLATLLAGKTEIDARIYNEKPKGFDLKLVQWYENTSRTDLSLNERIQNVEAIIQAFHKQHPGERLENPKQLQDIIGLSLNQARSYLTVIRAPSDVQQAIAEGQLNNLDKAAVIAPVTSADTRAKALFNAINGASLKEIKAIIAREKSRVKMAFEKHNDTKRGRTPTQVILGKTKQLRVVKELVNVVLSHEAYQAYQTRFKDVKWDDVSEVSNAFQEIMRLIEDKVGH